MDDIKQVGDQLVVTKTVVETLNIQDIKTKINELQDHRAKLATEQQHYTDLIAETDSQIAELNKNFKSYIDTFDQAQTAQADVVNP